MKPKIEPKKISGWGVFFTVLFSIIAILLLILIIPIVMNWEEVDFAVRKPNIVKSVRLEYARKQKALEDSFLKTELTPEQKLLDAVAEEIKK